MSNTELTLDISTLWRIFKKHAVIIVSITVVATIIAFILASFVIPKKYSASAMLYLENRSIAQTDNSTLNLNELNAAQKVIASCVQLFSSDNSTQKLLSATGLPYSVGAMKSMITMSSASNTEYMVITITMDDPQKAVNTVNAFIGTCTEIFNDFYDAGKIKPVDFAVTGGQVYPSVNMFSAVGFLIGFLGTFLVVFVIEILDTKVKAEDDLFKIYDIPVFAEILNFDVKVKGDYGYEYK